MENTRDNQNQEKNVQPDNILSLFQRNVPKLEKVSRQEVTSDLPAKEEKAMDAPDVFAEAIRRNKETQEKLRKERLTANKSVLRSYRIKN